MDLGAVGWILERLVGSWSGWLDLGSGDWILGLVGRLRGGNLKRGLNARIFQRAQMAGRRCRSNGGTARCCDGETGRRGDGETGRLGDGEAGRGGEVETGRRGDGETGRRGDGEKGGRGDEETGRRRRRGDGEVVQWSSESTDACVRCITGIILETLRDMICCGDARKIEREMGVTPFKRLSHLQC